MIHRSNGQVEALVRGALVLMLVAGFSGRSLRADCTPHEHTVSATASPDEFIVARLHVQDDGSVDEKQIRISYDRDTKQIERGFKFDGKKYKPGTELRKILDGYNPRAKGQALVNGGANEDATHGHVGSYILWKQAPHGDIQTKGWFGSDDYDDIDWTLPQATTYYEKSNTWDAPGCPHSGSAMIAHDLQAQTSLTPIGGAPVLDLGYSGSVTPRLTTVQTIRNVGGGAINTGDLQYRQDDGTTLTLLEVSVDAKLSRKKVSAGATLGVGATIEWNSPVYAIGGTAEVQASGEARSPASIGWDNLVEVVVNTDDMLATWDLTLRLVRKDLLIGEDAGPEHDRQPDSTMEPKDDSTGSTTGSDSTGFHDTTSSTGGAR